MAKSSVRLVAEGESPKARSAEREALSAAIAQCAEATQRLEQVREASARAQHIAGRADADVERATAVLSEAEEGEGAELARQILAGDSKLSASRVEAAAQNLAKAENHLRRSREAANLVKLEIPRAEAQLRLAEQERDAAARAVIRENGREHISKLLQEALEMQAELIARRIALRFLRHHDLVAEPEAFEHLLQGDHLVATYTSPEAQNFELHPASSPWRNAVAALATDADAPLPD